METSTAVEFFFTQATLEERKETIIDLIMANPKPMTEHLVYIKKSEIPDNTNTGYYSSCGDFGVRVNGHIHPCRINMTIAAPLGYNIDWTRVYDPEVPCWRHCSKGNGINTPVNIGAVDSCWASDGY